MKKRMLFALAVCAAGVEAAAQSVAPRDEAANAAARVPVEPHRSAFEGYRPYKDEDAVRWREANEEVGRLGGHVGHVKKEAATPRGAPPGAPAQDKGHAGHGGRK